MTQPAQQTVPQSLPPLGKLARDLIILEENEAAPAHVRALAGMFRFALMHINQIGQQQGVLAKNQGELLGALNEQKEILRQLVGAPAEDAAQMAEDAQEMPPEPPPVPEPTVPLPSPPVARRQPKAKPAGQNGAQS